MLEQTYAEQVAEQNAAQLAALTETRSYDVPAGLAIGGQPYEAKEMTPLQVRQDQLISSQNVSVYTL